MVFGTVISSPRGTLSLDKALRLARFYLESAREETDSELFLVLCHDAEVSMAQAKKSARRTTGQMERHGIAVIYTELGRLLNTQGYHTEAQAFYKKSKKWGRAQGCTKCTPHRTANTQLVKTSPSIFQEPVPHPTENRSVVESSPSQDPTSHSTESPSSVFDPSPPASQNYDKIASPREPSSASLLNTNKQSKDIATLPLHIFPRNLRATATTFKPPEPDIRLNDTPQLACCLGLLQSQINPNDIQDPTTRTWLEHTKSDLDEQDRLKALATDVIRAFKRDELKDDKAVSEIVTLSPVLGMNDFRYLVKEFYTGIEQSGLLDVHQLEGLAQLIQGAGPGYLEADDLVKILELLNTRLSGTHHQSPHLVLKLTLVVSNVLDAMADADVRDLDREKLHQPLSRYLDGLKKSSDPYLIYQAAYAYQALLCVPDNESLWKATARRTGKVIKGVSGLVSSVNGLDLNGFMLGLKDIQQGLAGVTRAVRLVKITYDGVTSLAQSGQSFLECLKECLSFDHKCPWYSALRGADVLIRDRQLAKFRKFVCEAPCRRDPAFQWGVCQRLGDIAGNAMWDTETRRSAISFLGEIYKSDTVWGYQATVKQWALNILMQLSSLPDDEMQCKLRMGKFDTPHDTVIVAIATN
ncbi:hypothetical protein BGX34_002468 [Mortierella sp. NVP85]|nr:hypothetical protein BGX34_002468 [Mortierella sp. NVP85]